MMLHFIKGSKFCHYLRIYRHVQSSYMIFEEAFQEPDKWDGMHTMTSMRAVTWNVVGPILLRNFDVKLLASGYFIKSSRPRYTIIHYFYE